MANHRSHPMVDRNNQEWVDALKNPNNQEALQDLHQILLRGLRYALSSSQKIEVELETEDFVQESLIKILDALDTFRGESRFLTWAMKITTRVAFTELRRKRWKDQSIQKFLTVQDNTDYTPAFLSDHSPTPEDRTGRRLILEKLYETINLQLTEKQRVAVYAVLIHGISLEEVAAQLGTNRNALYKLLHDARKKIKLSLEKSGYTPQEILAQFS